MPGPRSERVKPMNFGLLCEPRLDDPWTSCERIGPSEPETGTGSARARGKRRGSSVVVWFLWLFSPVTVWAACTFDSLYAGPGVVCGLRADGSARCWGARRTAGTLVPRGVAFQQIAISLGHSCALLPDRTVRCWGPDKDEWPAQPPSFPDFVSVCAGEHYFCGLRSNGAAVCWGDNRSGQTDVPVGETFQEIACGAHHVCGRRTNGSVVCWGGLGASWASGPPGIFFQRIGAGARHNCGIRLDGTIACWGDNTYGQTAPPAGVFREISVGPAHNCGIRPDGSIRCWGSNWSGELSAPAGTGFHGVVSGGVFSCALDSVGQPACWGQDSTRYPPSSLVLQSIAVYDGNLCGLYAGGGVLCTDSVPPSGLPPLQKVAPGRFYACGLSTSGSIHCWGYNSDGQTNPPGGSGFRDLAAGRFHACALRADGTATCWGRNGQGQASPPVAETFEELSVGLEHSCGRRSDGTVVCWGSNRRGQSAVPSGVSFQQVVAGAEHTCGLRSDGTARCWGVNNFGQSSPPSSVVFQRLAAGADHTCGLLPNGNVLCWGDNDWGVLDYLLGSSFTVLTAGGMSTCGLTPAARAVCWGSKVLDPCDLPATVCSPSPRSGCHSGGGGSLAVSHPRNSNRQSLRWVLKSGPALELADFGDPINGSTAYSLCLYDDGELKVASRVGPDAARWQNSPDAYRYKDLQGSSDGFKRFVLRSGPPGRSSIRGVLGGVLARIPNPKPGQPLLRARNKVVVQLQQSDGACYETEFLSSHARSLRIRSARLRY